MVATRKTEIAVAKDAGTLTLVRSTLGIPTSSETYPLHRIRSAGVGVGEVCQSLYLTMDNGNLINLIGCTDRAGYGAAADAINSAIGIRPRAILE